jgi:hypothetical protein
LVPLSVPQSQQPWRLAIGGDCVYGHHPSGHTVDLGDLVHGAPKKRFGIRRIGLIGLIGPIVGVRLRWGVGC